MQTKVIEAAKFDFDPRKVTEAFVPECEERSVGVQKHVTIID